MRNKENFALITGGSSGIGEACAHFLAKEGKNLILVARREDRLMELKEKLAKQYGITVHVYKTDLKNVDEIETLFEGLSDKSIDVLINNAGLALGKEPLDTSDWNDLNTMIEVNIRAFTRVGQLCIPFLKKTEGHMINISSIAGSEAYEGGAVYCATKSYVEMISRAVRIDLMGTGIRVTDIAPGAIDTEFSNVRFKGDQDKAAAVYRGFTPLYANDIAETILFVLSRPQNVNIDYLLVMPTAQASATRIFRNEK